MQYLLAYGLAQFASPKLQFHSSSLKFGKQLETGNYVTNGTKFKIKQLNRITSYFKSQCIYQIGSIIIILAATWTKQHSSTKAQESQYPSMVVYTTFSYFKSISPYKLSTSYTKVRRKELQKQERFPTDSISKQFGC